MTHYELLGVPESAGIGEIRSAYRKLALVLHPDRNPGDKPAAERFKRISAAYQVLADPRTREVYDRERRRSAPRPHKRPSARGWPPMRPGPVQVTVFNPFHRGPIQVFPMDNTTTVVIDNVTMPAVRIFRKNS